MSNSTNKQQLDLLVRSMKKHPDIATANTKRNKEDVFKIWKRIENELNSLGPPVKSGFEWKKVWSDKKKYVKKKIAENKKHKDITGRSYGKYTFTTLEEAIIKLCALDEFVESSSHSNELEQNICKKIKVEESEDSQNENTSFVHTNSDESDTPYNDNQKKANAKPFASVNSTMLLKKKTRNRTRTAGKSHVHGELREKNSEVVSILKSLSQEIQTCMREICNSIDRVSDNQKLIFEETKRHNSEMERLRKYEIETKITQRERILLME